MQQKSESGKPDRHQPGARGEVLQECQDQRQQVEWQCQGLQDHCDSEPICEGEQAGEFFYRKNRTSCDFFESETCWPDVDFTLLGGQDEPLRFRESIGIMSKCNFFQHTINVLFFLSISEILKMMLCIEKYSTVNFKL